MRRILIDTEVLLWWFKNDPQLGEIAKSVISDTNNEVVVSAATSWEISIKVALGKLNAPSDVGREVGLEGFTSLSVDSKHGELASRLPTIHKDPFDRMLVAQVQIEGLELMTSDHEIPKYAVSTMDATK